MSRPHPVQLILCAHGSNDPGWRATFEELAAAAVAEVGSDSVRLAYLELSSPTLAETIELAVGAGGRRLRILPLFLSAGKHVRRDVATRVEEARARHPQLEIELLPCVGEDERVRSVMRQIVSEAVSRDPCGRPASSP